MQYDKERRSNAAVRQNATKRTKTIELWRAGKFSGVRPHGQTSHIIRNFILEKFHYKCCKCGWGEKNEFTNKVPLHLDHIDGNWKNNSEDNLRALCPNCHSLTHNYGSRNRGQGRPR